MKVSLIRRINGPLLLILLLSTALQFYHLAEDSLWGDEIFTAIFAAKSPAETIAFAASDIHPPLYYLLVGSLSHTPLWPQDVPNLTTDWLWRWPSAMMGVLAVAITYRLGLSLASRRIGLLAALLLAVAPIALKYGQEARMHILFMTLSVLATLFLALALKTNQLKYWLGYGLTTILNLYTMYFSFLIIAVHGAWLIGYATCALRGIRNTQYTIRNTQYAKWGMVVTLALLAYLPWWPVLIRLLIFRAKVGAVEGGVGSPWAFLPKAIQSIGPFGASAWLFLGLYLVGLGLAWRRDWPLTILGGGWLVLPLVLPIFLGDSRALHLRYTFILPIYLIYVALGLVGLAGFIRPIRRQWVLAAATLLLVILSLVGVLTIYAQRKPDWRGAAAMLATLAQPGDVIMTGPLWDDDRFLGYYYPQPEKLMQPPVLVSRLPGLAAEMSEAGGRLWLVTRYPPKMDEFIPHELYGATVLEQIQPNYDPVAIIRMGAELCKQAARSADDWAAEMEAGGVLNPDPRASRAGAYLCQGSTYAAVGDFEAALKPYQKMVESFPGWSGGYVILAKTYIAVDNLPAAVEAYNQAVRFNPAWQGSQADAAARLAAQRQWAEAVALYETITDE
jgi:mannosyltransferase